MNRADFFRLARHRLQTTPGAQLDPAAVDKTGSTLNILASVASTMAEECESRSQARFAAQLVQSADEGDLDSLLVELSKGKLPRKPAAAASLYGYLSRPVAAPLPGGRAVVPAGTKITAGGFTWTLEENVQFTDPGTAQEKDSMGFFTCDEVGAKTNNIGPDVFPLVAPASLFDPGLTFESIEGPSVGGADRERDAAYRARYALWYRGLDSGLEHLAAGALGVPGIDAASAVEQVDGDGVPLGPMVIYVNDVENRATEALYRRVKAALPRFRMLGQHVMVWGISAVYVPIVLRFAILDTFDVDQVQDAVRASMVLLVNGLLPRRPLRRDDIRATVLATPGVVALGDGVGGFDPVVEPVQDLLVTANDFRTTYRTRPELITFL